jgi:RNA polymerase sigma-32 factor
MNEIIPNDLRSYFDRINRIPRLEAAEEKEMAKRLEENEDIEAAQRLIMGNLWFVAQVAQKYLGYGLPYNELIQEGNIGLLKAVKKFSYKHDVRLATYAVHWIKSEIHEYIIKNWKPVKVATTKSQRKLFFNLRKNKKSSGWMSHDESIKIAEKLNVNIEDVKEMEGRIYSINPHITSENYADDAPVRAFEIHADTLPNDSISPEEKLESEEYALYSHQQLWEAIETLDERSRDIIHKRWIDEDKATLHELADEYDVSAERIRQIESKALKDMRTRILN